MIKGVQADQVKVQFQPRTLTVAFPLPKSEDADFCMEIPLFDTIVPSESTFKVKPVKLEFHLKKATGIKWPSLRAEAAAVAQPLVEMAKVTSAGPASADSQAARKPLRGPQDWDQLAKEVDEEEKTEQPEGDAALNRLFQQIYSDASEDTKRAMLKSFQESNGTVLSTNWDEVSKGKVEMKPPDDVEYKKFDS
ncbi:uncharacterized protein MONBRDRAFT_15883 [Monosiga brevicollis MX1]|uniref:SGS domain-containing protein n=1 Tax=Monosiga brevicollis TaxID=81824 RepID=A9UVE1_MONBE|nr:uncharacterized protein MONBRDRAFT_15883 [Monosiga brevicollis MX1]EDQ90383.1 predicted protein [Monosiga brevicollis MX1]|eukprot:XP_001744434.1 hypothetical protein [Monosiga brevicollis MX1]